MANVGLASWYERGVPTNVRQAALLLAALLLAVGCGDDEHKGTISTGSAQPTASVVAPVERALLVYSPGTPIATTRTAERFKRRLDKAGLKDVKVGVGGEVVHVEPVASDVEATKNVLTGGRLDVHVFSDTTTPFDDANAEDLAPLTLGTDTVATEDGTKPVAFLKADPSQRDALEKVAQDKSLGARAFSGPLYEAGKVTGWRSYFADSERSVRGEMATAAKVEDGVLAITFEGNGKSFRRWQGKQKGRLLVRVDGDVIAAVQLDAPVTDGVLRVKGLPPERATAVAADIDGTSVSHECVFKEKK